ncbi:MAG: hypothetical protein WC881_02220 [Elusimicrobiota bacterium]|jgi:hypothetical protein
MLSTARRWLIRRRTETALFGLLLFSAAYFCHRVEYDNTLSRYFLISSIVDFGRLDIGWYAHETADVSVHAGRTYSNKSIGAPLLALPVYAAIRSWPGLRADPPLSARACYVVRLWAGALPYALCGLTLYLLLLGFGLAALDAYLAVLAYSFGTLAWVHASLFSGHQTAASLALLSFAAIWWASHRHNPGLGIWLGAGLLAGTAALSDYLCGLAAAGLAAYAWRRSPGRKNFLAFCAGLAACAAVLAAYNTACFGAPWRMSFLSLDTPFAGGFQQGWFGILWPQPGSLLRLLFSPSRGLFFIMPVLLMAVPGFRTMFEPGRARKEEAWLLLIIVCGTLLANSGLHAWHGGWGFGPRYLVCILPFLAIPMAFGLDRRWFAPLFALSLIQVIWAQAVMPDVPQYISNPILECLNPLRRSGYLADNLGTHRLWTGAWSLLPWLVVAGGAAWLGRPASPPGTRSPRPWDLLYVLACVCILSALAWVRSPDPVIVAQYNARLAHDANVAAGFMR